MLLLRPKLKTPQLFTFLYVVMFDSHNTVDVTILEEFVLALVTSKQRLPNQPSQCSNHRKSNTQFRHELKPRPKESNGLNHQTSLVSH